MTVRRSLHITLHAFSGGILVFVGLLAFIASDLPSGWEVGARVFLGVGSMLLLFGALDPSNRWANVSRRLCLAVATATVTVGIVEVAGRVARFDFGRQEAAQRRTPPFFRAPRQPVPPVFYRRAGPESWTGSVLKTGVALSGTDSTPFRDEAAITVEYDELGFRNEMPLRDWEVAISGDSFVELGFLPFDQLFTTRVSALTGLRTLNLGVSHTGPLTQLRYLELYGLSPVTRTVAIVFFEGNDLNDLAYENQALQRYEATGVRDFREPQRQTSFLRAIATALARSGRRVEPTPPRVNAQLTTSAGEVPITLTTRLVPNLGLSTPMQGAVERFLNGYAQFARTNGVSPVLIFMPSKTRCVVGRFRWGSSAEEDSVGVLPLELPEIMRLQCEGRGIAFYDLTAALHIDTSGELLFNAVVDSHLNRQGSEAVAHFLAQRLVPPVAEIGNPQGSGLKATLPPPRESARGL